MGYEHEFKRHDGIAQLTCFGKLGSEGDRLRVSGRHRGGAARHRFGAGGVDFEGADSVYRQALVSHSPKACKRARIFLPEWEVVVVVTMEHIEVVAVLNKSFGHALMVINVLRRWPSASKDVGNL
jgi:hypothetical protein